MTQISSDESNSKVSSTSEEALVEANKSKEQVISQNPENAQTIDAVLNGRNITRKRMSNSVRAVLYTLVCSVALALIGFIVPSEPLVTMIGEVFMYIGPVVGLVLGILVGRAVISRAKAKHLQKTGQKLSKVSFSTIFFAILAFVGVFVSYAITFFVVAMFLSVRACELSGSSKCM